MQRRNLIILLGAALLPTAMGRAQEPGRIYRLGILRPGPPDHAYGAAFRDELRRSGFVEGQNLQIDDRDFVPVEGASDVAMAMVATGVEALSIAGEQLARAVQKATRTVPILTVGEDLVLSGLVSSLAHPGGNTTGLAFWRLSSTANGRSC